MITKQGATTVDSPPECAGWRAGQDRGGKAREAMVDNEGEGEGEILTTI